MHPVSTSLHVVGGRRETSAELGAAPIGQILLENDWVREEHLATALAMQAGTGARLGEILVAHGWVRPEFIATSLAEQYGLGFADLEAEPPETGIAGPEDADICVEHKIVPWRRIGKLTIYATSEPARAPDAIAKLSTDHGMGMVAVATPGAVEQSILSLFGPELAERAAARAPFEQSVRSLGSARALCAIALGAGLLLALSQPVLFMALLGVMLLVLNVATTFTRISAAVAGRVDETAQEPPEDAPVRLSDRRPLPKISLMIPLYREAGMVRTIRAALEEVDYPRELLDVKLLLEQGDDETQAAVALCDLPNWITPVILPDGAPRTKPRAMNLALSFCDGDIVGILDAEDRPDPGQLRAVAAHLAASPVETACVQCQLSYFNFAENWITRCFQIEYSIWFDVLLRGFQRLGLPIPLGGTSVYFRRTALEGAGAWDAHNVTEDADLGMRLARRGLKTDVLKSTTMEEANCRALPWIRQRSRWLKGYLLTWLSHMRRPRALWRDLGPVGFLGFNVLFLGGVVTYLAMPLFWIALGVSVVSGRSVYGDAFPDWALMVLGTSLVIGQLVMLGCAGLALWRRRMLRLLLVVPTLPVYWTLGALAAWKAVIEVVAAPYYWDKTRHGVTRFAGGIMSKEKW